MQKTILVLIIVIILIVVILGIYFLLASTNKSNLPGINQPTSSTPTSFEIQGMKVEILKQGSGPEAQVGDRVTVHYVGTLQNGKKFDSSIDRNAPFTFPVGKNRVIKGFDLGVLGMKVGEKRRLTIPPELGYGSSSFPLIPKNSTLIYEVELLKITK